MATASNARIETTYHRTRGSACVALDALIERTLEAKQRALLCFDFPFGYPQGFAARVTGRDDALALWAMLRGAVRDDELNRNNRWEVAGSLNALFGDVGPFWGRPASLPAPRIPTTRQFRYEGFAEFRKAEKVAGPAQSVFKLFYTGSVGSQAILGIPRLQYIRERFAEAVSVWPFEAPVTPIVLAEVYPSLLSAELRAVSSRMPGAIHDEAQVACLAHALVVLDADGHLADAFRAADGPRDEGCILGLGAREQLSAAAVTLTTFNRTPVSRRLPRSGR